jgi:hypothetical protein
MVVSLDKFTTVKMFDKVQRRWKEQIKELRGKIKKSGDDIEKQLLQKQLDYMRSVEMAVVVSEEGDEEKKFAKQRTFAAPFVEGVGPGVGQVFAQALHGQPSGLADIVAPDYTGGITILINTTSMKPGTLTVSVW